MSAISVSTSHRCATSTTDKAGKRSYTAYYIVEVDDGRDGPVTVINYLASQGIEWGMPFVYGNDSDATSFCNGISPVRRDQSILVWDVVVSYGPPDEQKEQTPGGDPSEEPNDWRWQHNMGYSAWQEPCWTAVNKTAFPHIASVTPGTFNRPIDTTGPVVNSANVVLDPPLMTDMYDLVWQVTTYSRIFNGATAGLYMGAINSEAIWYSKWIRDNYGFKAAFWDKHQVKCTNASATFRTLTIKSLRIPYWEWTWEFRFRKSTWIEYVLDRGITSLPEAGMPTGTHGPNNPNFPNDDITVGRAPVIPVTDEAGRRVPELVLFDGAGHPMLPTDPRFSEGYYFGWRKDSAVDFRNIPFDFFDET